MASNPHSHPTMHRPAGQTNSLLLSKPTEKADLTVSSHNHGLQGIMCSSGPLKLPTGTRSRIAAALQAVVLPVGSVQYVFCFVRVSAYRKRLIQAVQARSHQHCCTAYPSSTQIPGRRCCCLSWWNRGQQQLLSSAVANCGTCATAAGRALSLVHCWTALTPGVSGQRFRACHCTFPAVQQCHWTSRPTTATMLFPAYCPRLQGGCGNCKRDKPNTVLAHDAARSAHRPSQHLDPAWHALQCCHPCPSCPELRFAQGDALVRLACAVSATVKHHGLL
jgi:hypothetical protein